jgi:hypothetical protein
VLKTCNITERTEKKKKTAMKIFYDCQWLDSQNYY